ncbi:MAG: 2,3-bisphosphoglycerate-independent phosphoglycerate mutase [Deltaproteobacteria bacterium]|nr:2,3-bisphosphoglycerate-independent phosphoglycerate mutase [Deltaproteobacteria bacterium]
MNFKKPHMLMILDGWGYRESLEANAIALAKTPHYDQLLKDYPHCLLDASGHAVGLPDGIMGNSEVGHLNIGAGRIAKLGLTRIYSAIESGEFFRNSALLEAMNAAKQKQSALHLMGLVSDGAVHSHQDHLYALLKMAKEQDVPQVFIHVFCDGRDTDPQSAKKYVQALQDKIQELSIGKIASISGRYYSMDRDQRWERTQLAYEAIVEGKGIFVSDPVHAIEEAYANEESDEFIRPRVLCELRASGEEKPLAKMNDKDAVIFFNFRADRARQLTRALTEDSFSGFERKIFPHLSVFVCMSEYDKNFGLPVAFPSVKIRHTLGEILSEHGLKQLRIAETEKYAHVTFFFNGGEEKVFPGEERILVPSPREVATYDLKPEMSAPKVTEEVLEALDRDEFDVIILNFANADMVGHSGKLQAAIQAVEVLDEQIGKIFQKLQEKNGVLLLSADHGNCEQMQDEKKKPHTAHTTDLVPFILAGEKWKGARLKKLGTLADIAPTFLQILELPIPAEMTGNCLLQTEKD